MPAQRTTLLFTAGVIGLSLASPLGARADMCFHYQISGGGTLVARGANVPPFNTCQPLALYERATAGGGVGLEGAATGSICQDWAGATVIFHYTYDSCIGIPGGSYFESATCRLQLFNGGLPTSSSTCRGTVSNGGVISPFVEVNDAILEKCDGESVQLRVPNDSAGLCVAQGFSHKQIDRPENLAPRRP